MKVSTLALDACAFKSVFGSKLKKLAYFTIQLLFATIHRPYALFDNGFFFLLGFHVDARDISNYVTWMEDHPSFIEQAISYDVLISSYE